MKSNLTILAILFAFSQSIYSQVGIGTDDPQAKLEVNGDLIVKQTPNLNATAVPLFVDSQGKVGKSDFGPSPSTAFLETGSAGTNFSGTFNSGGTFIVPMSIASDAVINTLGISQVGNSVQVSSAGIYSIGGSANIRMRTGTTGDYVYIAVNIEKRNPDNTWSAIAGTRPITTMVAAVDRYYTIVMPQAVVSLNANDRVRLVVFRTRSANNTLQGSPVQFIQAAAPAAQGTKGYTFSITKL